MSNMKTNPFTRITAGLAAILITPAYAIEAPADDAPPPPVVEAPAADPQPAAGAPKAEAKEETAYLGVVSSEVPEMLAQHLGLKQNEGIIVRAVMPDGPAAKAGIAVHDIITRVGEKAVNWPQDLTEQVQARKPGETVHLDLIQKGKPAGVDVALGNRPEQLAGMNQQPLDQLNLEGIPKDMADRIRGAIQGNLGGIQLDIREGAVEIAPQMEEAMREMRKRMEKAMEGLDARIIPGDPRIEFKQDARFVVPDMKGKVEIKTNDGGKEVTVYDRENKIVWTGPWDTEQDKAAAPDDIRQRVEQVPLDTEFKGQGMRFKFGGRPLDEDGE